MVGPSTVCLEGPITACKVCTSTVHLVDRTTDIRMEPRSVDLPMALRDLSDSSS
jgi:hypothetical protein